MENQLTKVMLCDIKVEKGNDNNCEIITTKNAAVIIEQIIYLKKVKLETRLDDPNHITVYNKSHENVKAKLNGFTYDDISEAFKSLAVRPKMLKEYIQLNRAECTTPHTMLCHCLKMNDIQICQKGKKDYWIYTNDPKSVLVALLFKFALNLDAKLNRYSSGSIDFNSIHIHTHLNLFEKIMDITENDVYLAWHALVSTPPYLERVLKHKIHIPEDEGE